MSALISFTIPIFLPSLTNARDGHWRVRLKRSRLHRLATMATWAKHVTSEQEDYIAARLEARKRIAIGLTRISPRRLDTDNVVGACKSVRDQIAHELGVDDGDDRLVWVYDQRKGDEPGVLVEISA
jgi:hypothetical protein